MANQIRIDMYLQRVKTDQVIIISNKCDQIVNS